MTKSSSSLRTTKENSSNKNVYIQKKPSQIRRRKKYEQEHQRAVNKDGRPVDTPSDEMKGIYIVILSR